jgi:hypothetical protein
MTTPQHPHLRANDSDTTRGRDERHLAPMPAGQPKYFLGRPAHRWREALHGRRRPRRAA